jgi:CBS domain containing-hemolysin-like protein
MFGARGDVAYVTEEEIKTLVDAGSEEGVLEDEEKEMIYSIFQFGDLIAREIMIPRIDIVALDAEEPLDAALDLILKKGHSRIPIYEDTIDNVIGLIYAKDLLKLWRDQKGIVGRKVREMIRPAYFIPESKKAGDLLADLQQRKIHLAIVVDEYGGTAGLVTIEDLIEEIVGDIQDEYDPDEEAEYTRLSDDEFLFDAGINLGEVNDLLDVELPTDESDTLGGYVFSVMGKVPLAGEVIRENDLMITVETITGRRIRKVRVQKVPTPAELEKERDAEAARDRDKDRDKDKEREKEPEKETGTHPTVAAVPRDPAVEPPTIPPTMDEPV